MFHETDAGHADLCGVVDCVRGEILRSREATPARTPTAPSADRPRHPPQNQGRRRPSFSILRCLPSHMSTYQVTTSLRSSPAVSPSLLPAWGFGAAPAHPRDTQGRSTPVYSRCRQKKTDASRSAPGKTRAVPRLVGYQQVFLHLRVIFLFFFNTTRVRHSSIRPKVVSFTSLCFNQLAKLSFNHPSVVLTADVFRFFLNKKYDPYYSIMKVRVCLTLIPRNLSPNSL